MYLNLVLMIAAALCALQALRTKQLLASALWLACTSGIVAGWLYALGAHEVAVIELSVGAGLVTVLFVFGITIAGEDALGLRPLVPWALAGSLALALIGLVGWFILPVAEASTAVTEPTFSTTLWDQRGLDMLVQIGLIFAGVLGILGILAEKETAEEQAIANYKARQTTLIVPQTQAYPLELPSDAPIKESHV